MPGEHSSPGASRAAWIGKRGCASHHDPRDRQPLGEQPVPQPERHLLDPTGRSGPVFEVRIVDVAVIGVQAVGGQVRQLRRCCS